MISQKLLGKGAEKRKNSKKQKTKAMATKRCSTKGEISLSSKEKDKSNTGDNINLD